MNLVSFDAIFGAATFFVGVALASFPWRTWRSRWKNARALARSRRRITRNLRVPRVPE